MRTLVGSGVGIVLFVMVCGTPNIGLTAEEKNTTTEQPAKSQNPFDISLTSGKGPINIRSGKLEFFYNEKRIIYRGDVVATRDNGTIKSDLLTVTYEEQEVNNGAGAPAATPASTSTSAKGTTATRRQRIKEAVAEGNVVITSDNGNATCKKAVFNEIKRTVTLSGDAVLQDKDTTVKGETVIVYLDENRVTVEGSPGMQPETQFTPRQDNKGNKEGKTR